MRNFYFNWFAAIALVFLLAYCFFAFMGMLYFFDGDVWRALLLSLLAFVLIIGCVYWMTRFKMSKYKKMGRRGEIFFGTVMLALFLVAAVPFTSFITAWQHSTDIENSINETKKSAINMDMAYAQYVDKRVDTYLSNLRTSEARHSMEMWEGHTISPPQNIETIAPTEKMMLLSSSLRRQLMPPSIETVQKERRLWIDNLSGMSIWNIMLPANLHRMNACVDKWTKEYEDLSDKSFENTKFEIFTYPGFNDSMKQLLYLLQEKHLSLWAVIAALFCFTLMLLPYWSAERVNMPNQEGA